MLEDRIIVQDRGIDAGLAALMQNANKGIDPTSFTNRQIDNTATVITSTGAKALLNGSGTQMTNNEITTGNRYLIYYNKCDGIFQVINHIVTPTTPAT